MFLSSPRLSLGLTFAWPGLAAVLLLVTTREAIAAPQRLDCNLTERDTQTTQHYDTQAENRSITIIYDEQANTLVVAQNGLAKPLDNVTFSESTMDGYVKGMSLGLDRSDQYVTFQTYTPDINVIEIGTCSPSSQPLPNTQPVPAVSPAPTQ